FILMAGLYSLFTMDLSLGDLEPIAKEHDSALSNWFFSAVNYVSFITADGAALSLAMGEADKDPKVAARGGLVGGIALGIMIVVCYLAIFSAIAVVGSYELPMLRLVDLIFLLMSFIMTFLLFGMIFIIAISMFYSFTARFMEMNTFKANIFVVVT